MGESEEPLALNRMHVVRPGPFTTVQDAGRRGFAHLGVPRAGFVDPPSAMLANRLVGNPPNAAVLEVNWGEVAFRFDRTVRLAVTGAFTPLTVAGKPVHHGQSVVVPGGALVALAPAVAGLRAYVAVSGGVRVPEVLGSASFDVLAGIGPAPLRAGDLLRLGVPQPAPTAVDVAAQSGPTTAETITVRLLAGPQHDWFAPPGTWLHTIFTVSQDSNRVGVRLTNGTIPKVSGAPAEMTTEPMVLGAVQVPPSGEPVIFLADHPTTGGYPVVGVVHPDDLPAVAQRVPGQYLSFR